ncbi:MAG: radical SAM protein [Clostridia bacterium]|nr:radical SAM protein [Clostridia bacterium]
MTNVIHAAERKVFKAALDHLIDKVETEDAAEAANSVVNLAEKILGSAWKPESYQRLRDIAADKDSKWVRYADRIARDCDHGIVSTFLLNAAYEGGFRGFKTSEQASEEYKCNIPWIVLMDPTSACNLHCTGCWAAEYGHKQNLSFEVMDKVLTEGKELGIHACLFTGGEPLVRKKDIIRLCEKHPDVAFHAFTNGTLIDDEFCKELLRVKNFFVSVSIEGFEETNDARRGQGVYQKVLHAMELMKSYKIPFGVSICYTSKNYTVVTSDEFLDMLIDKGCYFAWYFHYMPVGMNASTDLLLTPEQRLYMKDRIREIRGLEGGKEIFAIDFQNDGEFVGGCVAGGKRYMHINAAGDVEPCVFIHYSGANINDMSILDCLRQPLFLKYYENQPFNDNHLRPCPMLENPEILRKIVAESGAKSTDLESPETAEHLCSKCDQYAAHWAPVAEKVWAESHGA